MRNYDVITFDCYGTLIDWESGIGGWFQENAAADRIALGRSEALAAYAETEPAVEAESFRAYRDVLTETVRLITAQQVRSYKPAPGHFETARRRIGESRWLHAAQSRFHDVVPCRALGIPVAWVNRKAEPARTEARPDLEVRTLAALADALESGGA